MSAAAYPMTDANGNPVEIKRYPTRLDVRCRACGHAGSVAVWLADIHKLKCSRCGRADPIVSGREPLRAWAARRRKANAAS